MKRIIFSIAVLFIATTSCSILNSGEASVKKLIANEWAVKSILGTDINPMNFTRGIPNISFKEDGNVTGFGGCNTFFSTYNLTETGLDIRDIAATRMACEGVSEAQFLNVLERANNVKFDGSEMILLQGAETLMTFVKK
ncbi:META domain-containing protein [Peijinzhouia sedimentorum]